MAARTGSVTQITALGEGTRVQFDAPSSPAFVPGEQFDIRGSAPTPSGDRPNEYDRRYRVRVANSDFLYDCDVTPRNDPAGIGGTYVEFVDPVTAGDVPAGQRLAGLVTPFGAQIHPEAA